MHLDLNREQRLDCLNDYSGLAIRTLFILINILAKFGILLKYFW